MSTNWHIGQKVVSLVDMPYYGRKSGEVFTIRSISACRCGVMLDVGIETKGGVGCQCHLCRHCFPGTAAFGYEMGFRPIDPLQEALDRIESEPKEVPELIPA